MISSLLVRDLAFSDFSHADLYWAQDALRDAHQASLHFLDFKHLPWTAAILAAPRDHVLGAVPMNSYDSYEIRDGIGAQQAAWTQQCFTDKTVRAAFKKELKQHGLSDAMVPHGLLPYDGGIDGRPVGYNQRAAPLVRLWFRTYLIPQSGQARALLAARLQAYLRERGDFFMRPVNDALLEDKAWEERFYGVSDHAEAILFRNLYFGGQTTSKPAEQIALLKTTIAAAENGNQLDFLAMSPGLDEFALHINYPFNVQQMGFAPWTSPAHDDIDLVNALRAHLVNILEWPIFIRAVKACRQFVVQRLEQGLPSSRVMPYDTLAEIDDYLARMKAKYPSFWDTGWDDIWRHGAG